ncbi:hypothetical protein RCL_jg4861.t1 [Rhizophagus clarus]|uniref:Uncharacterized protein n=1 Tax=Rhizophagus clarus TaxID=94130 RepID=A0A8H3MLJ9_9GLOM|nr:hypothetical protein RCL_jg4861.t1 [Rhizophagus clarus]
MRHFYIINFFYWFQVKEGRLNIKFIFKDNCGSTYTLSQWTLKQWQEREAFLVIVDNLPDSVKSSLLLV